MKVILNDRQFKIIEVLKRQESCLTSSEIAKKLSISSKTVQNEILDINKKYKKRVIESKKGKGYWLKDKSILYNDEQKRIMNDNRKISIVKELIMQNEVDYYELADKLSISTSLLNKHIKELNKEISDRFNVFIMRKMNKLYFKGENVNKQKVVVYYLLEESETSNFDLAILESYFSSLDVQFIRNTIYKYVSENKIFVTDFELMSILLHVLTAQLNQKFQEYDLEDGFSKYLYSETGMLLNKEVASRIDQSFKLSLGNHLASDCLDYKNFLISVFDEIKKDYSIDFSNNNELINGLALHLKYAVQRCKMNMQLKNPLLKEFQKKYVLVYDIATYISAKFLDKTSLHLNENEVSYIAMHLLGALQKQNTEKLKVVLVSPYGKAVEKIIVDKLSNITNVKYCGNYSFLDTKGITRDKPDLILTLVNLDLYQPYEVYKIEDYLNPNEYKLIEKLVKQIRINTAYRNLTIMQCFDENLFLRIDSVNSKNDLINIMCENLYKNGFVREDFIEQVYKRESIAPTCFSDLIAIPHGIKKSALKSGVCVAILKQPVTWNEYNVRLVFLFALDKTFDQIPKLYELILDTIDNQDKYNQLIESANYSTFISILMKGRN